MAELSLFILRTQSLHLYRSFLRALREAPKDAQGGRRPPLRLQFYQLGRSPEMLWCAAQASCTGRCAVASSVRAVSERPTLQSTASVTAARSSRC